MKEFEKLKKGHEDIQLQKKQLDSLINQYAWLRSAK